MVRTTILRPTARSSPYRSSCRTFQGFLTAVLQNHARKHAVPVNLLGFKYIFPDILQPEVMQRSVAVVCLETERGRIETHWARKSFFSLPSLGILSSDGLLGSYVRFFVVPQDVKSHPTDGVLVYGMHIEGASWDHATKRLCDPRPDQMRAPAPIVHFLPENNHKPDPGEQLGVVC